MNDTIVTMISHTALATALFLGVNWIGKHAVEFGYTSATLFEESTESVALNFFLRAMSPAVFIIGVSAFFVSSGQPEWRLGIKYVAIYYYVIRAGAVFILSRQSLVSWPKFALHAAAGITFAYIAYQYLIVPNRSLLPDLEQAGNELWLAILAFLYAVSNKIQVSGGPSARRRNNFIKQHYKQAHTRFGHIIDTKISDKTLKLITYAVIVYEDYARPVAIRGFERWMFWKLNRTTGIMQVKADKPLSDLESVVRGTNILVKSWAAHINEKSKYDQVRTIADYNADADYIGRVLDVAEILAVRTHTEFRDAYDSIWE